MQTKSSPLLTRFPLPTRTRPALLRVVLKALSIQRERQHLRDLDPHLLKDVGLSQNDVDSETNRPVWDAPNRWLR